MPRTVSTLRAPWRAGLLAALLAALVAGGCGEGGGAVLGAPNPSRAAIIDGEECPPGAFPSALALLLDATVDQGSGPEQLRAVACTATLIAPDVVLTAAHCVDPTWLTFGFGTVIEQQLWVSAEPDLGGLAQGSTTAFPEDAVPARGWVAHPQFDITSMDGSSSGLQSFRDVALVFLDRALAVEPAVVIEPAEVAQLVRWAPVQIVGWGQQTADPGPEPPPEGTVGLRRCGATEINELDVWEMQIGDVGTRKCRADSGGPTYLEVTGSHRRSSRVVGVTSHSYDQQECAKGAVDTRVDAWRSWVDDTMTQGCADRLRVWCELPGILPASYWDGAGGAGGGSGGASGAGGDGAAGEGGYAGGWIDRPRPSCAAASSPLGSLVLALALLRRRRR